MTDTTKPLRQGVSSTVTRLAPASASDAPPSAADFVRKVQSTLDDWTSWVADTERGLITPAQLLALVLWVLQTEKTTEEDEFLIIEGWASALLKACQQEVVVALHPVTLLPIDSTQDRGSWVLSLNHANWFLAAMPVGFDCIKVLEHFRLQALELAATDAEKLTYVQACAQRKAHKSSRWTLPQKDAVFEEIARRGGRGQRKSVAKDLDIEVSTLNTQVPVGYTPTHSCKKRPPVSGNTESNLWSGLIRKESV